MPIVPRGVDNVTTEHDKTMALGLALAQQSIVSYPNLTRPARGALLKAWAAFAEDLAACGIRLAPPTALQTPEE